MDENKIIFNGVFGSKLYGLDHAGSDEDFKGVYMPEKRNIIFNTYKDTIEKQTKEVDTTFFAVTKFIRCLEKCDTNTIDMINVPASKTLVTSSLWGALREQRHSVYCKNMRGLLGYIRTQSAKYNHKVYRYKEMLELARVLSCMKQDNKIFDTNLVELIEKSNFKYIKFTRDDGKGVQANVDICGKRFTINATIGYISTALSATIAKYGERTQKGSLQGGDWKSLSHAYRVLVQLDEIIDTREVIFPLSKREEIMKVKMGELSQIEVLNLIDEMYDKVTNKLEKSDLPEYNDLTEMKNIVMNYYFD